MPRIALIHDWLTGMRGGEKVLEVLCTIFPQADIFTLLHVPGQVSPTIERHHIVTSPLQKLPGIARSYRHLLPLMPWAIEQFDFTGYDLLISSSHCVAKGARPPVGIPHWSYCHTPMRYIWDQYDQYFSPDRAAWPVRQAMRLIRSRLQQWDVRTAARVHAFWANSVNVQQRIRRIYGRESDVIYPPVDTDFYSALPVIPTGEREDFYLVVSALAPYKRIDLAIEACRRMKRRLVIIGEGQTRAALGHLAGSDVTFLGWRCATELRDTFRRARALLFPGEEDFGITPVEALAAGCPVIAFGRGGALETIENHVTGLFFEEQSAESLAAALHDFERLDLDPEAMRKASSPFSRQACEAAFRSRLIEVLPEKT